MCASLLPGHKAVFVEGGGGGVVLSPPTPQVRIYYLGSSHFVIPIQTGAART